MQLHHLLLHVDVELTDTLKGKLLFLDKDPHRVPHKFRGDIQHLLGHGG